MKNLAENVVYNMDKHNSKINVLIISGPTASGKSTLATDVALRLGGEIISCDSMQIYKGMDIGTAKITDSEKRGVPHYMLDIVNPQDEFSVYEFSVYANKLIKDIFSRGKLPVLVGGTGLYIESVIYPLTFAVDKDDKLRKRLREEYDRFGAEYMHEKLKKVDPEDAEKIHPNNAVRLLRALEIYELTGKAKSDRNERTVSSDYNFNMIVLNPEREKLIENIALRVDKMFENGILEEIQSLLNAGVKWDCQSMQAIGYKEFRPYFEGKSTIEDVKEAIIVNTRRYAKRQLTWMRRYGFAKWFDPYTQKQEIYKYLDIEA